MKRLIMDLDETICVTDGGNYAQSIPVPDIVEKLREYKALGFEIVIYTSRNVRTFEGNTGKITAHTVPVMIDWLRKHNIPYDEVYIGKPWCGNEGFYVDDKAIRPSEFLALSHDKIIQLINQNR
jgi:capsule biosynthesis phosphatase